MVIKLPIDYLRETSKELLKAEVIRLEDSIEVVLCSYSSGLDVLDLKALKKVRAWEGPFVSIYPYVVGSNKWCVRVDLVRLGDVCIIHWEGRVNKLSFIRVCYTNGELSIKHYDKHPSGRVVSKLSAIVGLVNEPILSIWWTDNHNISIHSESYEWNTLTWPWWLPDIVIVCRGQLVRPNEWELGAYLLDFKGTEMRVIQVEVDKNFKDVPPMLRVLYSIDRELYWLYQRIDSTRSGHWESFLGGIDERISFSELIRVCQEYVGHRENGY